VTARRGAQEPYAILVKQKDMLDHPVRMGSTNAMSLFRLAAVFLAVSLQSARAEDTDDSLLAYAVAINRTANSRSGTGIYLGNGLVITASHVVGRAVLNNTSVTIAGQDLPARVIKQDSFEKSDLALLKIDDDRLPMSFRLRRISLCQARPWPGEDVITVVPEETVRSHVMSPVWLPIQMRQFDTVISDVARTGNSGSGVFDTQKKCLLGIMSRKLSQIRTRKDTGSKETHDIAKYFVPASKIAEFMPAEFQFPVSETQSAGKSRTSQPAQ
jgi:S1-C subfamily serine protease